MGTSSATISRLREHQSSTPSRWRENAEWRMKNRSWLRYSQRIAMMMLDKMEEMNMSQKQLSELMGCSQQYVSKVLKGQENLSLETMSKIEACLGIHVGCQCGVSTGYMPEFQAYCFCLNRYQLGNDL